MGAAVTAPDLRLCAEAATRINGVRAVVKLLMAPSEDGRAVYGLVALSVCPGVVVATFKLDGDDIEFWDDVSLDGELARVFGLPAVTVRDHLSELVGDVIRDMLVDQPGGTTVH